MIRNTFIVVSIILTFVFFSCKQSEKPTQKYSQTRVPVFVVDSAYQYIQDQVDFGPRVPNTPAHKACAEYLSEKLQGFGADVIEQKMKLTAFNGDVLDAINIIASYNLEKNQRILLFAHWDTRPWADQDPDPTKREKPVLGANDGASGVGVLLEVARQLSQNTPSVGVDIILFDAEDYGAPDDYMGDASDSWCLGSQYWAKNPHKSPYYAKYGILLDMVGAKNSRFYREQISDYYAKHIVDKVWNTAKNLGFEKFFVNQRGGAITDDHFYVNELAGIPSVDIIEYDPQTAVGFGSYWHTTTDDMSNIDKETLFAVGTTLLHIIFNEN